MCRGSAREPQVWWRRVLDGRGGGDDSWPRFPPHGQVLTYLSRYAAHFGLDEQIRLRTQVDAVLPLDSTGRAAPPCTATTTGVQIPVARR